MAFWTLFKMVVADGVLFLAFFSTDPSFRTASVQYVRSHLFLEMKERSGGHV